MRLMSSSVYWMVCLINGAVLCVGTVVLVLSPASISRQVVVSEVLVLTVGIGLMLVANGALLRSALAPVDRVIRAMRTAQLGGTVTRLDGTGLGPGARLVQSYHAMLDRLEAERAESNAKALAAQEAERGRIGRELHDQVGQSLTVVLLGLKQIASRAPDELQEELELVRDSARAALDDVRRVARELRPGVLEDLGLHAALSALASDLAAHGGPNVRRTIGPGLPPLGADGELVTYRVAQEALTNVARHAAATRVDLSLLRVGDRVVLEVTDDGRGFAAPASGGIGLAGMRDRAALVGGTLTVTSAPGAGTTVRLEIPCVRGGDAT